jgi:riboflavin synthase
MNQPHVLGSLGLVLSMGAKMDYTIEFVARAIHEAEQGACRWDDESAIRKERFREYARNAINLLDEDIGVLLFALQQARAGACSANPRAAA